MQWEYNIVALGLIVDATEQNQREKHEEILNDLGRQEWEAVTYIAQSDGSVKKTSKASYPSKTDPTTPVIIGVG